MPLERLRRLAIRLNVDPGGRAVDELARRVWEVWNGLPPSAAVEEEEPVTFARADDKPAEDAVPSEDDVPEDERRRRLFRLAAETLGPDLVTMTEEEARAVLTWCPVLPSGEAADCYVCPRLVMARCWGRNRPLVT